MRCNTACDITTFLFHHIWMSRSCVWIMTATLLARLSWQRIRVTVFQSRPVQNSAWSHILRELLANEQSGPGDPWNSAANGENCVRVQIINCCPQRYGRKHLTAHTTANISRLVVQYCFSAFVNCIYAMTCSCPSCAKTAPLPSWLASVIITNVLSNCGNDKIGGDNNFSFKLENAASYRGVHCQDYYFFFCQDMQRSCYLGEVLDEFSVKRSKSKKLAQRFVINRHWPIHYTTSLCRIYLNALLRNHIPQILNTFAKSWHLLGFNFRPASFSLLSTAPNRLKCFSTVWLNIHTSTPNK